MEIRGSLKLSTTPLSSFTTVTIMFQDYIVMHHLLLHNFLRFSRNLIGFDRIQKEIIHSSPVFLLFNTHFEVFYFALPVDNGPSYTFTFDLWLERRHPIYSE